MTKLYQPLRLPCMVTRDRGGITADHVLRQGVHLNAAGIQVVFNLVPIGRLTQMFQQMACRPSLNPVARWPARQVAQGMDMPLRYVSTDTFRWSPVTIEASQITAVHPQLSPCCVQWRGICRPRPPASPS